jgi:hypothetical protein
MAELTFRPVGADDWPAILNLAHLSLSELTRVPRQDEWLDNRREFSPSAGFQHQFVPTSGERIVGYAVAERRNGFSENVYRLFVVVAPHERASLGTILFEKLRRHLIDTGARRAWMMENDLSDSAASWASFDSAAPQQENVLVTGQAIASRISEMAADVFLHLPTCDGSSPVRMTAEKKPR